VRYKVALGIAQAIAYLHNGTERCVVHRDIKPSNILLSSKKVPKVRACFMDYNLLFKWFYGIQNQFKLCMLFLLIKNDNYACSCVILVWLLGLLHLQSLSFVKLSREHLGMNCNKLMTKETIYVLFNGSPNLFFFFLIC
jgi:serine/threonine protein kinase